MPGSLSTGACRAQCPGALTSRVVLHAQPVFAQAVERLVPAESGQRQRPDCPSMAPAPPMVWSLAALVAQHLAGPARAKQGIAHARVHPAGRRHPSLRDGKRWPNLAVVLGYDLLKGQLAWVQVSDFSQGESLARVPMQARDIHSQLKRLPLLSASLRMSRKSVQQGGPFSGSPCYVCIWGISQIQGDPGQSLRTSLHAVP